MTSLFDEMRIGTLTARNRIVRSATAESLATPAGCLTPELLGLYGQLAWGGVGTIITAFFMGPLIEFFNVKVARPFLAKGKKEKKEQV